ncbi:MAG: hypothetical protein ACJA00_000378 [Myxococcota bacterium]|jgi:hypothetical protein
MYRATCHGGHGERTALNDRLSNPEVNRDIIEESSGFRPPRSVENHRDHASEQMPNTTSRPRSRRAFNGILPRIKWRVLLTPEDPKAPVEPMHGKPGGERVTLAAFIAVPPFSCQEQP